MSRPEFDLINWVKPRVVPHVGVVLGIGDDAAILSAQPTHEMVVATDMLLEGVHFTDATPPELIGRKALAVNLSDLAAMGARPESAFVSVGLPRKRGMHYAEQVLNGILELAREWGVEVAGGDTNTWDQGLVVNVAVTGHSVGSRAIRRTGSLEGDVLMVTGPLGGSLAGHHLTFTPRIREAGLLVSRVDVHAMLDLSDGLSADLGHLLDGGKLGAEIWEEAIPVNGSVPTESNRILRALTDGEDFELLFTVSENDQQAAVDALKGVCHPVAIGTVNSSGQKTLKTAHGIIQPLIEGGWSHSF